MRKTTKLILPALLFSFSAFAAPKAPLKTLTLITHESPPYMSEKMPDQGAAFYGIRKAIKPLGYELKVIFAPSWIRAKMDALKDPTIDGYGPIRVVENPDVFSATNLFAPSPWVIIERKDHPIKWHKPEDLTPYVGGNENGVEYRPGFKELVESDKLKIETTSSLIQTLQKLATKRIDFAFANANVFRYLMATQPELKPYRRQLQINPKPVVVEAYGIAIRKKSPAIELVARINLKQTDIQKDIEDYIQKFEKEN